MYCMPQVLMSLPSDHVTLPMVFAALLIHHSPSLLPIMFSLFITLYARAHSRRQRSRWRVTTGGRIFLLFVGVLHLLRQPSNHQVSQHCKRPRCIYVLQSSQSLTGMQWRSWPCTLYRGSINGCHLSGSNIYKLSAVANSRTTASISIAMNTFCIHTFLALHATIKLATYVKRKSQDTSPTNATLGATLLFAVLALFLQ